MVERLLLTGLTDEQRVYVIAFVSQSSARFVKGYIANLAFLYCRGRKGYFTVAYPEIGIKVETWNDDTMRQ